MSFDTGARPEPAPQAAHDGRRQAGQRGGQNVRCLDGQRRRCSPRLPGEELGAGRRRNPRRLTRRLISAEERGAEVSALEPLEDWPVVAYRYSAVLKMPPSVDMTATTSASHNRPTAPATTKASTPDTTATAMSATAGSAATKPTMPNRPRCEILTPGALQGQPIHAGPRWAPDRR